VGSVISVNIRKYVVGESTAETLVSDQEAEFVSHSRKYLTTQINAKLQSHINGHRLQNVQGPSAAFLIAISHNIISKENSLK
jgi:hypothetical protein